MTADFQTKRPGRDWSPLATGGRVLSEDSVRAVVSLPRFVTAEDLEVLLDDSRIHSRAEGSGLAGDRSRVWVLTIVDPIRGGTSRTLSVRIAQSDGGSVTVPSPPIAIETEASFALDALFNVPNPFAEETWFFYSLGAPAGEVAIRIYTSSGRLIRTLRDLPSPQSLNDQPILWDGRDEDGDPVANGLYFYKLTARGPQGALTRIEKLARVR
ncbi:MAG: hypothetical protein FJY88_11025 [Candidatus Eisenbacteria bacterium]|nr:hypothetical protein [Candidatus Eisenbacteria bacterium]